MFEEVVIGSQSLPRSLIDTAHISILNTPIKEDGHVSSVSLRLGGIPPGSGQWEVRAYAMTQSGSFCLVGLRGIAIDPTATDVKQDIPVEPVLPIAAGQ